MAGAAKTPPDVMLPTETVQVTAVLNEPVPVTLAEYVPAPFSRMELDPDTATPVIVGAAVGTTVAGGGGVVEPPPQATRVRLSKNNNGLGFIVFPLFLALVFTRFRASRSRQFPLE